MKAEEKEKQSTEHLTEEQFSLLMRTGIESHAPNGEEICASFAAFKKRLGK